MALVISKKTTRSVPIEAKEPLDGDKVLVHRFDVEIEIVDKAIWKGISERWDELSFLVRTKPESLSDADLAEARESITVVAAPYIKNITPLLDAQNQPIAFSPEVLDAILAEAWLLQPITDAFMAVQRGLTSAEYKKSRRGN